MERGKSHKLVGGHDSTEPIERIRAVGHVDAVQRDLAAHKEDEEGLKGVDHLFLEGDLCALEKREEKHVSKGLERNGFGSSTTNLTTSLLNVGNNRDEGLADVQETNHCRGQPTKTTKKEISHSQGGTKGFFVLCCF